MALIFENKIKGDAEAFKLKLIEISGKLAINPNWLMWVMNNESGLNPQAQNKTYLVGGKPATGLIQFVDSTAQQLGTSVEALYTMDGVQQLDYVYKYFKPYAGRMKSIYDVYNVVFFPLALGKPDDWIFATKSLSASKIARSNPIFDLNHDDKITIAEFKQAIDSRIKADDRSSIFPSIGNVFTTIIVLTGIAFLIRAIIK